MEKRKYETRVSRCARRSNARRPRSSVEEYHRDAKSVLGPLGTRVCGVRGHDWSIALMSGYTHDRVGVHTPRRAVVARARRRHRRARERCAGANRRAYDRQRIERACPREGVART